MTEVSLRRFDPGEMDDGTAALILKLQYEDLQGMQSSDKGKGREDEVSDFACAIETMKEEMQNLESNVCDRAMSRSLARAVITDSALLNEAATQANTIAKDRAFAERLSRGEVAVTSLETTETEPLDDLLLARLSALYVQDIDDGSLFDGASEAELPASESSTWAASRNPGSIPTYECVTCGERKRGFEVLRTPCKHYYCADCISTLFELSMTDETLFPPRCCRERIPINGARLYLTPGLLQRFDEKSEELSTPNRIYCSRPTCSAFIKPANITTSTSTATCTLCSMSTCTTCKGNAHNGDCPEDLSIQATLATAREEGWQRCTGCGAMVELDTGCNHIT